MQWDLFCRVVDNFGDIGVCWRLAAELGARGERVRLWADDLSALAWMAPDGARHVEVRPWPASDADIAPGEVVVEAFGCELPPDFVRRMAAAPTPPRWINLEYLSAQDYVERSHKLASPQSAGAGAGLRKWFFFPGFTTSTGGLLRETDLLTRQRSFDRRAWLVANAVEPRGDERVVSLFCYEAPALGRLLQQLAAKPTLLLAVDGEASRQVLARLGPGWALGHLRALPLAKRSQRDYDHLLWSADLNFVRGEDSFVRAQWAAKPFVWQVYRQDDGAHHAKLEAFAKRFRADDAVRSFWHAWNAEAGDLPPLPVEAPWRQACEQWRTSLLAQADLATQLCEFVVESG